MKSIDYQKMKFVLSFVVNETKLASVYSKQKLTAFFQKKENKELLKFKISSIKKFEKVSFKRFVLLFLIKHKKWNQIHCLLKG